MSKAETNTKVKKRILKLLEISKSKEWKPWELQTELKRIEENVIAVGDDLSFTIKLDREIVVDEEGLKRLGGRRTKIYPFKRAFRFNKGFIAVEGRFIRVSKEFDPKELIEILRYIE